MFRLLIVWSSLVLRTLTVDCSQGAQCTSDYQATAGDAETTARDSQTTDGDTKTTSGDYQTAGGSAG